jgi:hypothetical protein
MPVLVRGLKDRSAEAKRRAALIIGSMTSMAADAKDLLPYLDAVLPGLKVYTYIALSNTCTEYNILFAIPCYAAASSHLLCYSI